MQAARLGCRALHADSDIVIQLLVFFLQVPEIEYIDVAIEKVIEVPEVIEQVMIKHIPVTQ